jgi:SAM-dependent methyltransferase
MHGEADLVESFGPSSVLDAGCGTGRVAIELHRRGHHVVGVDLDPAMLEQAGQKAPDIEWVLGDLADPDLAVGGPFDLIVLAGNVLIFVEPGTESAVISNLARRLGPGGLLVAGYSLRPGGFAVDQHDAAAERAGLALAHRWATWDRQPFSEPGHYAVSVHQAPR